MLVSTRFVNHTTQFRSFQMRMGSLTNWRSKRYHNEIFLILILGAAGRGAMITRVLIEIGRSIWMDSTLFVSPLFSQYWDGRGAMGRGFTRYPSILIPMIVAMTTAETPATTENAMRTDLQNGSLFIQLPASCSDSLRVLCLRDLFGPDINTKFTSKGSCHSPDRKSS